MLIDAKKQILKLINRYWLAEEKSLSQMTFLFLMKTQALRGFNTFNDSLDIFMVTFQTF
jgi:hypothetical protein